MKRRIISAMCLAAAVFLTLSGCGTGAGRESQADTESVQEGANAEAAERADEEDAPDGADMETAERADGENAPDGADAEAAERADGESGPDGKTAQAAEEQVPAEPQQGSLTGQTLSILGDSISTFRGYNLEGYAVFFPDFGEVTAVEDTWWQRVVNDLGLVLCKNGSSSGATVVGDSTGTTDPACACNELRTGALAGADGACPNLIIVYLGTNDMMNDVPLGTNDGTTVVEEGEIASFSDAYTLMLDKLQAKYPQARIYCCTLLPMGNYGTETPFVEWVNGIGLTSADYSRVIVQIAENKGLFAIDLQSCGVTIDNLAEMSTDGVHPKPAGMACIAETVGKALKAWQQPEKE